MERADVDRPVAHVAKRNSVFAPVLAGKRQTRRQRQVLADDGVAAVHETLLVEIVHGAAQALRAARGLAEQLGHAGVRAGAAREGVAVVAVGGDEVIIGPRGRDAARR